MAEQFRVQQALFGYREGHNLITSSVSLSPRVRHFLATVTDGSGSETADGFEVSYTGLPVPETDYYALFCTWPAPEMPRPGCVWSHLLLLNLTDLARIPDLSIASKLCVRPHATGEFSVYQQSLNLIPAQGVFDVVKNKSQKEIEFLLNALYGDPDSGVVVLDETSVYWESIVFAIWSQQWPKLRRNFAFSTGSLGDRRSVGVTFDLQIAPKSSERLWRRGGPSTVILDLSLSSTDPIPLWAEAAADDLKIGSFTPLRQFLFTYGSDIEKPRHTFAALITAYEQLRCNNDWTKQLHFVAETFPNPSDALRLKESLITPPPTSSGTPDLERTWAVFSFLLGIRESRAYSMVSFDYSVSVPFLWKSKQEDVLSLLGRLVRQPESPAATAFVAAVANAVQPYELKLISSQRPELLPILLSHRHALAFEVDTWQLPTHTQWQITEVLDKLPLSQKDWGEIVAAKFIAATNVAARDAVEKAGPYAIESAFRWLEKDIANKYLPSQPWREALASKAVDRLRDPKLLSSASLALCAWFVPPEAVRQLLTASRPDIQRLAQQPLDLLPEPLRLHTAFLLVTLGLRATKAEGVKLIKRGYFQVYDALAASTASNDLFAWESWVLLSDELPKPGLWRDWDKCERLRRAVRRWLLEYVKTGNPLLDATSNKKHSEIARQTFNDDSDDDTFID